MGDPSRSMLRSGFLHNNSLFRPGSAGCLHGASMPPQDSGVQSSRPQAFQVTKELGAVRPMATDQEEHQWEPPVWSSADMSIFSRRSASENAQVARRSLGLVSQARLPPDRSSGIGSALGSAECRSVECSGLDRGGSVGTHDSEIPEQFDGAALLVSAGNRVGCDRPLVVKCSRIRTSFCKEK
jgi:hypothetical protein